MQQKPVHDKNKMN